MDIQDTFQINHISSDIAVIIATSYINPISFLPQLEADLADWDGEKYTPFNGCVFIDLALCNGANAFNRFVKSHVVDGKFDRAGMKVVPINTVHLGARGMACVFYRLNPQIVAENQILSDEEKESILNIGG
jgi:Antitoxin to bacterial toxin RNase LS or RnlA